MRDPRQPILKAIRCAISVKFGQEKEQREKGFENFVTEEGRKLPIIYMTDDIPEDWINYYQTMLNLPKSCFYVHRIRKIHEYSRTIPNHAEVFFGPRINDAAFSVILYKCSARDQNLDPAHLYNCSKIEHICEYKKGWTEWR